MYYQVQETNGMFTKKVAADELKPYKEQETIDKTTWDGFQRPFKDGDIVAFDTEKGAQLFIFKEYIHDHWYAKSAKCYMMLDCGGQIDFESDSYYVERLATEEERKELFDAIKANGYKWNEETKTLEKLPKFKVDDKIKLKGGDEFGIITQVTDCFFTIKCRNNTHCWPIKKQDDWELVPDIKPKFKVGDRIRNKHINNGTDVIIDIEDNRYVLSYCDQTYLNFKCQDNYELVPDIKPKFKVGDKVVKKGCISVPILITRVGDTYYWSNTENSTEVLPIANQDDWELVPNKFDITTLKPYDKVLYRMHDKDTWCNSFYSFYKSNHHFVTSLTIVKQCIPYDGNEHLLGTTDDCDEFYKTWE
jgi:hypothetical protein